MISCVFYDTLSAPKERQIFEIVQRAYERHEKVVIFVPSAERASAMDRILWVLKQEAFIPHKILSQSDADASLPVGIVTSEINPSGASVLIADGPCSIDFACGFDSVHEFVDRSSAEIQETCRERFRAYRARQVPVEYSK
jgi:DNA polymerase IIIc chi subunit